MHCQDYQNREIDAVIEPEDGRRCAFEIKSGANQIDAAAKSLIAIRDEIAKEKNGVPPVRAVRDLRDVKRRLRSGGRGVCIADHGVEGLKR